MLAEWQRANGGSMAGTKEGGRWARVRRLPVWFWLILLAAVLARAAAFSLYATHHPDEAFQYLEQAHRLVFDYGLVPWEFRFFIRSWLIPLLLAGPMALGEALQPAGMLYLWLPRLFVVLVNLSAVVAAWFIGARSSPRHAIVAMVVAALWVESILFSVQTLSESLAVACFLPAAVLLKPGASRGRIVAAGALFALAGLLRYQFGIAIAIFAGLSAGRDWRLWRGLILGGLPVAAGGAMIDLAMGLSPYEWIVNGYHEVVTKDRMTSVGGAIETWVYPQTALVYWGAMAPLIVAMSFLAGRRYALLMIAAWANIAVHQLIGHKEWRYLWFSVEILLILAAIGSVNIAGRFVAGRDRAVVAGLVAAWIAASALLALRPSFADWRTNGEASALGAQAGRMTQVCGLSVPNYLNTEFGYHVVHRRIPLFLHRVDKAGRSSIGEASAAFNAVMVPAGGEAPAGYDRKVDCGGRGVDRVCLYLRPGGCTANAASSRLDHQRLLLKTDL